MKCTCVLILLIKCLTLQSQNDSSKTFFNRDTIEKNLAALSHDSMQGRRTPSKGLQLSAALIRNWFKHIGLRQVDFAPSYLHQFDIYNEQINQHSNVANIVGCIKGADSNNVIIISAHYDHIGSKHSARPFEYKGYIKTDTIFNGANDDATGVVALVELAKYYMSLPNIKPTIIFVAFCGEELGLVGSNELANLVDDNALKAVINLEMLGRFSNKKNVYVINEGNASFLKKKLNKQLSIETNTNKSSFFIVNPYGNASLEQRNDAFSFKYKAKTSFCLMATSPFDKYYHTAGDEISTINIDFLQLAIKNIALACKSFLYE